MLRYAVTLQACAHPYDVGTAADDRLTDTHLSEERVDRPTYVFGTKVTLP